MDFCEVCDSLLQPKKIGNRVIPFCNDCNESREGGELGTISFEDEDRKIDPEGGKMLILEDEKNTTTGRPRKDMYCKFEKNIQMVEYWEIQTRSADESPTRFFRCLNCDKNWREYD